MTPVLIFARPEDDDAMMVGIVMGVVIVVFLIIVIVSNVKATPLLRTIRDVRKDVSATVIKPSHPRESLPLVEKPPPAPILQKKKVTPSPLVPSSQLIEESTAYFDALTPMAKKESSPASDMDLTRYSIDPTTLERITSRLSRPESSQNVLGSFNMQGSINNFRGSPRNPTPPITSVTIFCSPSSESTSDTPVIKTYNL